MSAGIAPAACLVEKPYAPFGLVDPLLDQACRRYVVLLIAEFVRLAHARDQRLIVGSELRQHIQRIDIVGVIVEEALAPRNVADGAQRCAANFSRPLLALAKAAGASVATDLQTASESSRAYDADFVRAGDVLFLATKNSDLRPRDSSPAFGSARPPKSSW